MLFNKAVLRLGTMAVAGALLLTGCDDQQPTSPPSDSEVAQSRLMNMNETLTQVDRFGLPALNTAFVSGDANKDAFNLAAPANDAQFTDVVVQTLQDRYRVPEAKGKQLAGLVLPDVQPLGDLSGYDASGSPFNGRRPSDDVIDFELALLFGEGGFSSLAPVPALASDNVDSNDKAFLDEFPFLAPPHAGS